MVRRVGDEDVNLGNSSNGEDYQSLASPEVRLPENINLKKTDSLFCISTKADLPDSPERDNEPTTAIILIDKKIQ